MAEEVGCEVNMKVKMEKNENKSATALVWAEMTHCFRPGQCIRSTSARHGVCLGRVHRAQPSAQGTQAGQTHARQTCHQPEEPHM